jgi:hypothetical protein
MLYTPESPKREALAAIAGKYRYDYPGRLNLQPGSELHDRLVGEVMVRAQEAQQVMSDKYPTWTALEKTMTGFVDLSEAEKAIKARDPRKPLPMVIPVGFAMVETIMSFLVKAFLDNPPLLPLSPQGPEDTYGTILLEMMVESINQHMRNDLATYRVFRDSQVYGFGVATPRWRSEWGWESRRPTMMDNVRHYLNPAYRPPDEWSMLYEGAELVVIDPRLYWPDPSVPIDQPQNAEFVSWLDVTTTTALLEWEKSSGGDIFNARYAHAIDARCNTLGEFTEDLYTKRAGGENQQLPRSHPAHVVWMHINLVPREWKLGSSEYPEKWVFGVAGGNVLIQARPQGLRHNRFPVAVVAPDSSGRDVTPISRLELVYGMQRYTDWLCASLVEAQRQDVGGRWLVDPSVINMNDLQDTQRRFIRARRSQWGKGRLTEALHNFTTSGATQNNIAHASVMMQILKETSGAPDNIQGNMQTSGERRSATEARTAFSGALAKMERIAWMVGRQGIRDLGFLTATTTQQLISRGTYLSILGNRELQLRQEYGVNSDMVFAGPLDLQVRFDCTPHDGSVPSGEYADTWLQVFQAVSGDPELRQMFDIPRTFMHLARLLGAKNVQQFLRNGGTIMPQLAPEEAVLEQAATGKLSSIQEMSDAA